MGSGVGKPLHLRLFLEGQEIPVVAASISIGLNSPATASIQIIPIDEGMNLKPRTMVHLFFLDELPGAEEIRQAKEKGISEAVYKLDYYKILFTGEVIGFAFSQTSMSRGLVLQCIDFSSYWDAAHATAIEYGPGGNAFSDQSSVYGANRSIFDDIVNQHGAVIGSLLNQKPLTPGLQGVSGLAGGIIRVLETIGGVANHHKGVNDFFTFSELRCRVLAQITAEEQDNTASKLFNVKIFHEWLLRGLQNIGQQVTFRDLLKMLCSYIYYDTVANPVAKYDRSIDGSSEQTFSATSLSTDAISVSVVNLIARVKNDLEEAVAKPLDVQLLIAKGSIEYLQSSSKKLQAFGQQAKTAREAIDSAIRGLEQFRSGRPSSSDSFVRAVQKIQEAITYITSHPEKITRVNGVKSSATTARLRSHIIRPDCFFVAPPRCNVIFPENFAQVAFDRSYLTEVTRALTLVYNTLVGRDHLLADAKVMAPNIGLDLAKIERQVAGVAGYRILMPHERHTGIIPRSEWIANHSASSDPVSANKSKVKGARLTWANKVALFHFFKYRFSQRRIAVSGKFNPYVVCGFPGAVILKPFQPDLDKLKAILELSETDTIDTGSSKVLEAIASNASKLGAPYQLLGMIGSVTHSIDQTGGVTNIQMHHARRHSGADDEFVGVFSESTGTAVRRIRVPISVTVATAQSMSRVKGDVDLLKILVGVTSQQAPRENGTKTKIVQKERSMTFSHENADARVGDIGSTEKTKTYYSSTEEVETKYYDLVAPNSHIDGVERDILSPSPPGSIYAGVKGIYGKIVGIEVVDPSLTKIQEGQFTGKQVFTSIVMHEDVSIAMEEQEPVEEIIRPTWFSANYSNSKIGEKIYKPFFGTTSIIDGLSVTGLTASTAITGNDPEGDSFDPSTKFEALKQSLVSRNSIRTKISIEKAINFIAYFYGMVRTQNKDVDQFIKSYSTRPVATMVDLLGTADLVFSYDSKGAPTVEKGQAGFHSLALDRVAIEKGNMTGLVADPDKKLLRVNGSGEASPISPVYDIRKEKLDRVDSYILALAKGTGLHG